MSRVIEEKWAMIRGNSELYLLDFGTSRTPDKWNDPIEFPILPWLDLQLSSNSKTVIATWPDTLSLRFRDVSPIGAIHGLPRDLLEGLFSNSSDEEIRTALAGIEEEIVVSGHTHLLLIGHRSDGAFSTLVQLAYHRMAYSQLAIVVGW